MKIVLNRTYDIDDDYSLLEMSRRQFLELRFKPNIDLILLQKKINPIDFEILCDVLFRRLNLRKERHLYYKGLSINVYDNDNSRFIIAFNKVKYFALTWDELNKGVAESQSILEINERSSIIYGNDNVTILYDKHRFKFTVKEYMEMCERIRG